MNNNSIEQIMCEISKIEYLSNNIKDDTERLRDEYSQEKEEEFLRFESQIDKETEQQLDLIKTEIMQESEKEIQSMRSQNEKLLEDMSESFSKVYVEIAKEIVDRIKKE